MEEGKPSDELRQRATEYVDVCHHGVVASAAQALAVQYDFLNRFLKSGGGRIRHLDALEGALNRLGATASVQNTTNIRKILQSSETRSLTRAILQELMGALDAVEVQSPAPGATP